MPLTAGILDIVARTIEVLSGAALAVGLGLLGTLGGLVPAAIVAVVGIPWVILGIVAIAGGTYACKRAKWGLALGGSICAILDPWTWFLGIPAIVFTAMGKKHFK